MLRTLKLPTALGHSAKPSWWRVVSTPYFILRAHRRVRPLARIEVDRVEHADRQVRLRPRARVRQDAEVDEHAEAQIDVAALERLQRARRGRAAAATAAARRAARARAAPAPGRAGDAARPRAAAASGRAACPRVRRPCRRAHRRRPSSRRCRAPPPVPAPPPAPAAPAAPPLPVAPPLPACPRCFRPSRHRPCPTSAPLPPVPAVPVAPPLPAPPVAPAPPVPVAPPSPPQPAAINSKSTHGTNLAGGDIAPTLPRSEPLVRSLNEWSAAPLLDGDVVHVDEARPGRRRRGAPVGSK